MIDQYFDTFGITAGILIIVGVGLVLFLLIAILLERRTRILFPERQKKSDDESFFDFGDEDDEDNSK